MKSQILSVHSLNFDKCMHVCNPNPPHDTEHFHATKRFSEPFFNQSLPQLLPPRDSHWSDLFHHRLAFPVLELCTIPIICALSCPSLSMFLIFIHVPYISSSCFLLLSSVLLHSMIIPQFIYPFRWSIGLFLGFLVKNKAVMNILINIYL